MDLKNQSFETHVERHEEITKFEEGSREEAESKLKCSYLTHVISDFSVQICESKLTMRAMLWN